MANIKPECFECTNVYLTNQSDWYCRKHREFIKFQNGCDDFWPLDINPRCEECRFFVETVGGDINEGRCMHSSMQTENRLGVINATGYCENWRAR